jgi:hypothetical protein
MNPSLLQRIGMAINANGGRCALIEEVLVECQALVLSHDDLLSFCADLMELVHKEDVDEDERPIYYERLREVLKKAKGES